MAKKRKSKKQQQIERRNKAQEKQVLYWALGITLILVILSFIYFQNMV